MALIDCPECEAKISDQAASCPSCGLTIAAKPETAPADKSNGGLFEFVGFAMIVAGLVGCTAREGLEGWPMAVGAIGFAVFIAGRFMR